MRLLYTANPVSLDTNGDLRAQPMSCDSATPLSISIGTEYRPLGISIRVFNQALQVHYLVRADIVEDRPIQLIFEGSDAFKIIDKRIESDWGVLHASPHLFVIGNAAIADLEHIHDALLKNDKRVMDLILSLSEI